MLDDIKIIAQRDSQDALGVAEKQLNQLETEFTVNINREVENVVFAGMGGSALYAEMVNTWPGVNKPYKIVRDYNLPAYVGEKTLVIVSSFSGNTEETLSCLEEAEKRGAVIAVITAGGKLEERARAGNYPLALLDKTIPQPRMAAFAGFKALLTILSSAGAIEYDAADLAGIKERLASDVESWLPQIHSSKNYAKQLANELMGRSVVVYSSSQFYAVAYKWKISFNENAKNVAWLNVYPELNHNEFIGWTEKPSEKPYAVINLRSDLDNDRIKKRFEVSDRLLSGRRPSPENVSLKGENVLEQMLWGIILGDFVSLYLGILNEVDPSPVELVERLKKEL